MYFSFSIFGVDLKKIINVCLHFLDLKLNTNEGNVKERTHLFIFVTFINKKLKKKTPANFQMRKNE